MIGMTGVMAAAMRAPLTAALFAVELTGHFDALPATAATAGAAYAVAVLVLKRSILTEKISRRGDRKRVVSGKSVSVRVDIGGQRLINKKNKISQKYSKQ